MSALWAAMTPGQIAQFHVDGFTTSMHENLLLRAGQTIQLKSRLYFRVRGLTSVVSEKVSYLTRRLVRLRNLGTARTLRTKDGVPVWRCPDWAKMAVL
jgi:hypothetical protein